MARPKPEPSSQLRIDGVSAVILAGGRNSRMGGADKAFLTVDGQTVMQRTLRVLRGCFAQVVVVSNQPEKYAAFDVDVTWDEFRGHGPLAGIHAGLGAVRFAHAFVVACDMPFLRAEPIRYLARRLHGQDAVIPYWDGDIEPLHAIYAARLRPAMDLALRQGVSAIRDFLPGVQVDYVPEMAMRTVEGAEESFRNVNTPEEAARFAVRLSA
jgi:molybdopterin-guanine dinucleotide biosynthesis protein A